jgi:hypothetical protein
LVDEYTAVLSDQKSKRVSQLFHIAGHPEGYQVSGGCIEYHFCMFAHLTLIPYLYDFRGLYELRMQIVVDGVRVFKAFALLFCGLPRTVLNVLDQSNGIVNSRAVRWSSIIISLESLLQLCQYFPSRS